MCRVIFPWCASCVPATTSSYFIPESDFFRSCNPARRRRRRRRESKQVCECVRVRDLESQKSSILYRGQQWPAKGKKRGGNSAHCPRRDSVENPQTSSNLTRHSKSRSSEESGAPRVQIRRRARERTWRRRRHGSGTSTSEPIVRSESPEVAESERSRR